MISLNSSNRVNSSLIDAVVAIVVTLIVIVLGVIIMQALLPVSPFMATVGIIMLFALALAIVIGFIKEISR